MKHKPVEQFTLAETFNFLVTNRLPRRWATLFMGWFSRIENPIIARGSIALWRAFVDDLRLDEAATTQFASMHACFTRRLKPGARPIDPDPAVLCSPCDAIVGEHGQIENTRVYQAKGYPYVLEDLLADSDRVARYRDGYFITLRLKSSMYHRFHAPAASTMKEIIYISGDTWNVNPIALRRIERLFCKNERAVIELTDTHGNPIALVPIAAILVAGIRLQGLDATLDLRYRGPNRIPFAASFDKGQEMGYFQHGSTIVLLTPPGYEPCKHVKTGHVVRAGSALLRPIGHPTDT